MQDQQERALRFAALHVKGDPLVLFNVWDAGSAKAVQAAGARALATGSWSVAAANGYDDGEKIPLETRRRHRQAHHHTVDLPLTLDFESGYARGGKELESNVERIARAGAVGINFEDQWIGEDAIFSIEEQAARIVSVRAGAERAGVPLFIDARTDLFLKEGPARHGDHVAEAIARGKAYAESGANGVFVPGLRDEALIERVCAEVPVPVNVMFMPDLPPVSRVGRAGSRPDQSWPPAVPSDDCRAHGSGEGRPHVAAVGARRASSARTSSSAAPAARSATSTWYNRSAASSTARLLSSRRTRPPAPPSLRRSSSAGGSCPRRASACSWLT